MSTSDLCATEEHPALRALQPFGLEVAATPHCRTLDDFDPDRLGALVARHKVLVLRGFTPLPEKAAFADAARRFGDLLEWNFGHVLDLVVHERPQNYLFTPEAVPYHWDGAFAASTPRWQIFQCLRAPLPGHGGETTFCDTTRVLRHASTPERALWERLRITYQTDKLAHYGGRIERRLLQTHPITGEAVLRFAEPVDTGLNPVALDIHGLDGESKASFLSRFTPRLYEPDMVYAHAWQDGDFVVADNHALIHGRRAFAADSPRHLQRIHVL